MNAVAPRSANLGMKTSPALEELQADGRVPGPSGGSRPAGPGAVAVRQGEERRLVSLVFVELVPAGLGGPVDPEDLRELISAGLAQAMSEVEAFGGTVASISGFGMSVLFGAPQSYEDDPERALRAALRIAVAVGKPAPDGRPALGGSASRTCVPPAALSVRIGVESGMAVVGPVGEGDQRRYGAVGEVVGMAGALQSAAKPGTVLVGPATRAAADEIFEWARSGRSPCPQVCTRSARATSSGRGHVPAAKPGGVSRGTRAASCRTRRRDGGVGQMPCVQPWLAGAVWSS